MIQITERWSVYRDEYQWVQVETYEGKTKKGKPKTVTRKTYYPWMDQAMRYAAERSCEGADSLKEVERRYTAMLEAYTASVGDLERYIGSMYTELRDSRKALKRAQVENRMLRKKLDKKLGTEIAA